LSGFSLFDNFDIYYNPSDKFGRAGRYNTRANGNNADLDIPLNPPSKGEWYEIALCIYKG
jgi:hypothetical protein